MIVLSSRRRSITEMTRIHLDGERESVQAGYFSFRMGSSCEVSEKGLGSDTKPARQPSFYFFILQLARSGPSPLSTVRTVRSEPLKYSFINLNSSIMLSCTKMFAVCATAALIMSSITEATTGNQVPDYKHGVQLGVGAGVGLGVGGGEQNQNVETPCPQSGNSQS
ncbi:hypothetical protein L914_02095, partial [Phytophthora nicotianae]